MEDSENSESICFYCGYDDNLPSRRYGVVLFREAIARYVCTNCVVNIPRHIEIVQYKKYLDMKNEKR